MTDSTNLKMLCEMSDDQMVEWLFRCLREHEYAPLEFGPEPAFSIQLASMLSQCDSTTQERLKKATRTCVEEWNYNAHGNSVLYDLAVLCSLLRISRSTNALARHLIQCRLYRSSSNEDSFHLASYLIGVLAGFAYHAEVQAHLELVFFDETLDARLAAKLFLSLSRYLPFEYPKYILRYFNLRNRVPDYFQDDFILAHFLDSISTFVVEQGWNDLDEEARQILTDFADRHPQHASKIPSSLSYGDAKLLGGPDQHDYAAMVKEQLIRNIFARVNPLPAPSVGKASLAAGHVMLLLGPRLPRSGSKQRSFNARPRVKR